MNELQEYLLKIDEVIEKGKYKDTWESLSQYDVPNSFKNYKLGVFFHWGAYTVPENLSEWYPRNMYIKDSKNYLFHIEKYGAQKDFGYKDLIPLFKGEEFKEDAWLDLVESLGAKYIVPVAEHHDGFQMYESDLSIWNAKEMGPKRDITKALKLEATKRNIEFGVSSHRAEHIFFLEGALDIDSDFDNPQYGHLYWPTMREKEIDYNPEKMKLFFDDWLARCCEMVDKFSPKVFYFDWWIEDLRMKSHVRKFLAYYYNRCEERGYVGVVNYKHDAVPYGIAVRDMERGHFDTIQPDYWQSCTSAAKNSWCYTLQNEYRDAKDIILTFIDVISKNGNLLLNSGPRADGSFALEEVKLFKEVGNWVKTHSEAIFNTRVWKIYGEGSANNSSGDFSEDQVLEYRTDDFRFTCHANYIYVFIMNPSIETNYRVESLGRHNRSLKYWGVIDNITCISNDIEVLKFDRRNDYCYVEVDKTTDLPIVLKVELV